MKNKFFILILILSSNLTFGQTNLQIELENTLTKLFEGIPVLQSSDSILNVVLNDTSKYETYIKRHQKDISVEEIRVTAYHFNNGLLTTDETDIYYRTYITHTIRDTTLFVASVISLRKSFETTSKAKIYYRHIKRDLSKYFAKNSSKKKRNSFVGSKLKTTYFYLNKTDRLPFMEISWNRKVDGFADRCRIEIIKIQ